MASCAPPGSSARAVPILLLLLASGPVAAAEEPQAPNVLLSGTTSPLERLRALRKRQGESPPSKGPAALPSPSPAQKRRAFEALRKRSPAPAIEARARAAHDHARSAVANESDTMLRRISQALGLEAPDLAALARTPQSRPSAWVPVLFASSSVPVPTLRTYAAQLASVRGVIAFRGMPGGLTKVAPLAKLSAEILRIDPGCEGPACAMRDVQVIVDPLLFRQHGIAQVPALTMLPGDPSQPYCERENESPSGTHVVFGDAALSGLLEEYARLGSKEEVRDAAAAIQGR